MRKDKSQYSSLLGPRSDCKKESQESKEKRGLKWVKRQVQSSELINVSPLLHALKSQNKLCRSSNTEVSGKEYTTKVLRKFLLSSVEYIREKDLSLLERPDNSLTHFEWLIFSDSFEDDDFYLGIFFLLEFKSILDYHPRLREIFLFNSVWLTVSFSYYFFRLVWRHIILKGKHKLGIIHVASLNLFKTQVQQTRFHRKWRLQRLGLILPKTRLFSHHHNSFSESKLQRERDPANSKKNKSLCSPLWNM